MIRLHAGLAAWLGSGILGALSVLPASAAPQPAMPIPANIAAAVADGNRPDADVQRDANRKPAATLAFIGVKPDEQVLELIPGGGYFTRLLSKAVGNGGHVYAWVPGRPANAPADMPDRAAIIRTLAADANYSNLSVVQDPQLKLPAKVQLVFTAQNYHDLHNIPSVDVSAFNKAVFDALEPGGEYVVLDHSAEDASGTRDTATLHRIDAAAVKREVLAAGFQFVAGSDILANAADARTLKIFDPAIRGKTDQFIYKFRKPKR